MKRIAVLSGAAALLALSGCGGGGATATNGLATGGTSRPAQSDAFMRNGTVHFNQLAVAAMTIQDDNGSVLTPVNPPSDAFEGERVTIRFVEAKDPLPTTFVRTPPNPIVLLDLRPL